MTTPTRMNLQPLFDQADARAERIVAVIRLLIGSALFAFLLITLPDPFRAFRPTADQIYVPGAFIGQDVLALSTIGAFTFLGASSLALCMTGAFRNWMAWPFATLDAGIALASLWLGLLNTEMTGALAALIPASWILVIVLAFGALRYNVVLQLWLTVLVGFGLLAILWHTNGFLGPTWLKEATHPGSVFMMTPPTLMRLFMLVAAGCVISLAVLRTRTLVRQALTDAERQSNLTRYLPNRIADVLAEGDIATLRRGRRGPVAVLFVDLRGFTAMSEPLDPPAISDLLGRFRRDVSAATDACNGIVDKFVGDGAMIVFGLDTERASDADDAIRCADIIRDAVAMWSAERSSHGQSAPRIAMGLHWGEAFIGAVGDDARLEFTVLGDVVNVASRLETLAKQEDCDLVLSEAVLMRAKSDTSIWRSLGPLPIRGRQQEMNLFARQG